MIFSLESRRTSSEKSCMCVVREVLPRASMETVEYVGMVIFSGLYVAGRASLNDRCR